MPYQATAINPRMIAVMFTPNTNNDPAVTYPPTLCTSDIQNAKKLYEVHVCLRSGARSSLVNRGAYPGLITPAPARCSWCPSATLPEPPEPEEVVVSVISNSRC